MRTPSDHEHRSREAAALPLAPGAATEGSGTGGTHPNDSEQVFSRRHKPPTVQVQLAKLLARTGLTTSVSNGLRKLAQNAVKLGGALQTDLVTSPKLGTEFTLRAGKKMVRVSVEG